LGAPPYEGDEWGNGRNVALCESPHLMEVSGQIHTPAALPLGLQPTVTLLIVGWLGRFRKDNIYCLWQEFNPDSHFLCIKEKMKCLLEE
jgi:hypothetical protein